MATWLDMSRTPNYNPALANRRLDALDNDLGDLSWEDKVELAKLGETIIQGGFLKTQLIKTDDLIVGDTIAVFAPGYDPTEKETPAGAQAKVDSHNDLQSPHNLPSYCKMQSDGFKVFDASDVLRCMMGQYASGQYGILIKQGEIYSTTFSTRLPGEIKAFAELLTNGDFNIYDRIAQQGLRISGGNGQGCVTWFLNGIEYADAQIDAGTYKDLWFKTLLYNTGIRFNTYEGTSLEVGKDGSGDIRLDANTDIELDAGGRVTIWADGAAGTTIWSDVDVNGYFTSNNKYCVESTSFGKVGLHAVESPENRYVVWFEGELVNGQCVIDLMQIDPIFPECVEPHTEQTKWHVLLTAKGPFTVYEAGINGNSISVASKEEGINGKFTMMLSAVRVGKAGIKYPRMEWLVGDEDEVLAEGWEDELLNGVE